jgi:succinate-semialdehyde dehydrogenase/glutarate-semialdehyde dehydrogenase
MDGATLPAGILRDRIFIGGHWIDAAERRTFAVDDPASSRVLAEIPDSGAADARAAADAAHAAFPAWSARTAADRSRILKRWHGLILERREDLARLMTLEQGKPLRESRAEIDYAASFVEWFAEEARRAYGEIIPSPHAGRKVMVVREPVGVVAAITPWNFPAAMLTRKATPALAAGCTVVAKPSEDAPLCSLALARLAAEAGLPEGVLNVVTASRAHAAEVVDAWLADFRVRKLTFTGSTAVGKHLARESADTLKKVSLELGGNAPFIVFEDADLEAAVAGLMASKFRNAGQTCICPNRVFIHEAVVEPFTAMLTRKVKALRVGRGSDEATEIGPAHQLRAPSRRSRSTSPTPSRGARAHHRRQAPLRRRFRGRPLLRAHDPRRCHCGNAPFIRRDVRTGRTDLDVFRRAGSRAHRQRDAIRPRRVLLYARRRAHLARGRRAPDRHGGHQRFRVVLGSRAVRRREGFGVRPRRVAPRPGRVPAHEVHAAGRACVIQRGR